MKGIFASRPALPKTAYTWDLSKVITYLAKLSPPKSLDLLYLSCKLATLLALLTGQRGQSLHLVTLEDFECSGLQLIIHITSLLKQSAHGRHVKEVCLAAYPEAKLCVVQTCLEYLKCTKQIRPKTTSKFFITSTRPYRPISRDTLPKWTKQVLKMQVSICRCSQATALSQHLPMLAWKQIFPCLLYSQLQGGQMNQYSESSMTNLLEWILHFLIVYWTGRLGFKSVSCYC